MGWFIGLVACVFVMARPAGAQTLFFSGGNSQVWNSSTANWSAATGGPYTQTWAAGTAVFEGTGANVNVSGTIANIAGIRFDVAGYTLAGGSLPFPTHNSPIVVNADTTISATITGAGGIRKEGSGTLTLSGSNTFTGVTFLGVVNSAVDAGVLSIADVAALGTGTGNAGRVNFVGNGTLRYTGGGSQAITTKELWSDQTNSSMTIDVSNATGSLTISPTGGTRSRPFTKLGPGTLSMNGAFSAAATITANAGTLILGADNSNTAATTIAAGATLRVGAGGTSGALGGGSISNGGTLVVNRSNALTMAQTISGAGALVKEGAGTLTITGNTSYSGGTTVSSGTLAIGAGGTTGNLPGNATVAGTLTFNRSDAVTYAGILSGTGTLRKEAANTLALTGANTYQGGTIVSAGTLVAGSSTAFGSGAITVSAGGRLRLDQGSVIANAITNLGSGSFAGALAFAGGGIARTSTAGGGSQGTLLAGSAATPANLNPALAWSAAVPGTTIADVLSLTGTGGTAQVLSLSYDPAAVTGLPVQDVILGYRDMQLSGWRNAVAGNSGGTTSFFSGSWAEFLLANPGATPTTALGTYGHDAASDTVWAVINHNGDFSVVVVPEPGALVLAGLGTAAVAAGVRLRRRRT